jgi:hypothetical protein
MRVLHKVRMVVYWGVQMYDGLDSGQCEQCGRHDVAPKGHEGLEVGT